MSVLSNHWTVLNLIWMDGSLWPCYPAVLVLSWNISSLPGYKSYCFRPLSLIPPFHLCLSTCCLFTYCLKVKMFFFFYVHTALQTLNIAIVFYRCFTYNISKISFIVHFCIFAYMKINSGMYVLVATASIWFKFRDGIPLDTLQKSMNTPELADIGFEFLPGREPSNTLTEMW